jgi:hypothetical protein
VIIGVAANAGRTTAQDFSGSVGGDAVTRYNWRGLDFGDAASVQPYLSAKYRGLEGGFWGSYSADLEEIDTWVSYTIARPDRPSLTAIATAYYLPSAGIRLFDFHDAGHPDGPGAHLVEVGASLTGPSRFPLAFSAYVNVHNDPGNNVYLQLDYATSHDEIDMGFFIGATPGSTRNPAAYGSDSFAVINIGVKGTRNLKCGETEIALSTTAIVNPREEIAYLILGLGI